MRVLVDAAGRVGTDGRLFDASAPTLVATTDRASAGRLAEWRAAGAEVIVVGRDVTGGVDLARLLEHLGKLDVQGVLLEGGATLAWSFIRDDLIDRVVAYIAPLLLGGSGATGIVAGGGFASLADARSLTFTALHRVGPDLKVEADVHRDR
jgi:diaminohydroxyphosphoribosylaminopyrimidine deaminase/5-amino-6-(5-phosphoribosylamino)uracil reductase